MTNADQVRQLVLEEARASLRDFLTSVIREVPRLLGESDSHYEVRRTGGYCYHPRSAATLHELMEHTYHPMVDAMPIIYDLFWKRRSLADDAVQVELEQTRLRTLREDEPNGWLLHVLGYIGVCVLLKPIV